MARTELQFDLWAYVFMPDHAHIILRPRLPDYDIGCIRSAIKHPTSKIALAWLRQHHPKWIPKLTRKRGRRTESLFWQSGGGYDRNITSGKTLVEMIDYIHLNPVRAQLVDRADQWKWSSVRHYLGVEESALRIDSIPPDFVEL